MHTKLITNKNKTRTKANASDDTKSWSKSMNASLSVWMAIITLTVFHMPHALQTIVGYNVCKCANSSYAPSTHRNIVCQCDAERIICHGIVLYGAAIMAYRLFAWNDVNEMEMKLKAGTTKQFTHKPASSDVHHNTGADDFSHTDRK